MKPWWKNLLEALRQAFVSVVAERIITGLLAVLGIVLSPVLYGLLGHRLEPEPVASGDGPVLLEPFAGVTMVSGRKDLVLPPEPSPSPPPPPPPPQSIPLMGGGQATRFLRVCTDDQGKEIGRFNVLVFSDEYQWKCNSDSEVSFAGENVDFAGKILFSPGLQSYLEADEIVAVGSASCDADDLMVQECLALRRAQRLKGWVRQARKTRRWAPSLQDVHFLNLGRRQPPPGMSCKLNNCGQTGSQRSLMLLTVSHREPDVPLAPCLAKILASDPEMDLQLSEFSQFALNRLMPVSHCPGGDP